MMAQVAEELGGDPLKLCADLPEVLGQPHSAKQLFGSHAQRPGDLDDLVWARVPLVVAQAIDLGPVGLRVAGELRLAGVPVLENELEAMAEGDEGFVVGVRIGRINARARPWRPLRPGQSIPFPV